MNVIRVLLRTAPPVGVFVWFNIVFVGLGCVLGTWTKAVKLTDYVVLMLVNSVMTVTVSFMYLSLSPRYYPG